MIRLKAAGQSMPFNGHQRIISAPDSYHFDADLLLRLTLIAVQSRRDMNTMNSSSAILAAIYWLEALLQGSVAIAIAVIAVASVGLMMLTGRLELKNVGRVIFGCFLLFGASAVAQGIVGALHGDLSAVPRDAAPSPYHPPDAPALKAAPSNNNPYAGAAFIPQK